MVFILIAFQSVLLNMRIDFAKIYVDELQSLYLTELKLNMPLLPDCQFTPNFTAFTLQLRKL